MIKNSCVTCAQWNGSSSTARSSAVVAAVEMRSAATETRGMAAVEDESDAELAWFDEEKRARTGQ